MILVKVFCFSPENPINISLAPNRYSVRIMQPVSSDVPAAPPTSAKGRFCCSTGGRREGVLTKCPISGPMQRFISMDRSFFRDVILNVITHN